MISYHLDTVNISQHFKYTSDFCTFDEKDNIAIICKLILNHVTSPIIWENGYRASKNWMFSDWIVIDVDDGLTISDAYYKIVNYTHVIGTTKSHQKIKGKSPACDRFRVWLKLDRRCHDLRDYSNTVRHYSRLLEGDQQAVDGARKFLPSNRIVSAKKANCITIKKTPNLVKKVLKIEKDRYIPRFINEMLISGVSEGSRNYSCFVVGKYLSRNGFMMEEIVDMIMSSPIPSGSWCKKEVLKAVENGKRS